MNSLALYLINLYFFITHTKHTNNLLGLFVSKERLWREEKVEGKKHFFLVWNTLERLWKERIQWDPP